MFFGLLLEGGDLRPSLLQALLQGLSAPERGGAGTGADAHAVLCDPLDGDRPHRHQGRHAVGQQAVERIPMGAAEMRQGVVFDLHPAADPTVGKCQGSCGIGHVGPASVWSL